MAFEPDESLDSKIVGARVPKGTHRPGPAHACTTPPDLGPFGGLMPFRGSPLKVGIGALVLAIIATAAPAAALAPDTDPRTAATTPVARASVTPNLQYRGDTVGTT